MKLKVAILDAYQNVSRVFTNWDKLSDNIELDIFNEFVKVGLNCTRPPDSYS